MEKVLHKSRRTRRVAALFFVLAVVAVIPVGVFAGGTGTVTGVIFNDDDGNFVVSTSTDSNGVWESSFEGIFDSVGVTIYDGYTVQYVASAFNTGIYSATVQTDFPVVLSIRYWDGSVPLHYRATTDMVHVVDVDPGETVTVPDFGYGPQE